MGQWLPNRSTEPNRPERDSRRRHAGLAEPSAISANPGPQRELLRELFKELLRELFKEQHIL
jgi:hypothetical protein